MWLEQFVKKDALILLDDNSSFESELFSSLSVLFYSLLFCYLNLSFKIWSWWWARLVSIFIVFIYINYKLFLITIFEN
jgi:hypothetical protein